MSKIARAIIYHREPLYGAASVSLQNQASRFLELTDKTTQSTKNINLSEIVALAQATCELIKTCNPFLVLNKANHSSHKRKFQLVNNAARWEIYQISKVALKVHDAMDRKKLYYSCTLCGRVKSFFLHLFGLWNNGYTHSRQSAEDFLLYWNPTLPLKRKDAQTYEIRMFWDFKMSLPKDPLFYSYYPAHFIHVHNLPRRTPRGIPPMFVSSPLKLS